MSSLSLDHVVETTHPIAFTTPPYREPGRRILSAALCHALSLHTDILRIAGKAMKAVEDANAQFPSHVSLANHSSSVPCSCTDGVLGNWTKGHSIEALCSYFPGTCPTSMAHEAVSSMQAHNKYRKVKRFALVM